jgi:hypothetical protein
MREFRNIAYTILSILACFLALTAFAGGIGLMTGLNAPSPELLTGSIFGSFTVPGLSLFVLVGGIALAGVVCLLRRCRSALPLASAAGIAIMFFEFVEILVIGSPPGLARALQIFYFGLGTVIAALAVALEFLEVSGGQA